MKKVVFTLLAVFLCTFLSSCTIFTNLDANALMSPPKSDEDNQAIHTLMEQEGSALTFVYPKNGDYRSAIIVRDEENAPFKYSVGFSANPSGGINLKFMVKQEDDWEIIFSVDNLATQVDRVYFGDMNGDSVEEIIVGWGSPQSLTATLSIFSFLDGKVLEYPLSENYNEIALTDFNSDNVYELFSATIFTPSQQEEGKNKEALGKLYTLNDNTLVQAYSVELTNSVTRYSQTLFGNLDDDNTKGLVIDGVKADNSMITQVIVIDDATDTMQNPLLDKYPQANFFQRPPTLPFACRDINDDTLIEFPLTDIQSDYETSQNLESYNYSVSWISYDDIARQSEPVLSTIINLDAFYYISVPSEFPYEVMCAYDTQTPHKLNFYYSDFSNGAIPIFTIDYFSTHEWEEYKDTLLSDYTILLETENDMIYVGNLQSTYPMVEDIMLSLKLVS